jgi:ribulose-phosphate 3-epimerase
MSVVVPALLGQTKEELDTLWLRVQPFANRVHIDMMDGQFAPGSSATPTDLSWSEGWEVDIHMMYQQPMEQLPALIAMNPKPSLVVFHAEAEGDLLAFTKSLQEAGIKAGVALMRPTVPDDKKDIIAVVDHVLIFSGDLGKYGGKANMLQLEKVQLIRKINENAEIGWDGGANVDNSYTLALGGIDVINVGNALASADDPAEVYRKFDFEVHRKDVLKKKQESQA